MFMTVLYTMVQEVFMQGYFFGELKQLFYVRLNCHTRCTEQQVLFFSSPEPKAQDELL